MVSVPQKTIGWSSVNTVLTANRLSTQPPKSDEKIFVQPDKKIFSESGKSTYAILLQCAESIDVSAFQDTAARTFLDTRLGACVVVKQPTTAGSADCVADKLHKSSHATNLSELSVE